jgi:hypothetical protein
MQEICWPPDLMLFLGSVTNAVGSILDFCCLGGHSLCLLTIRMHHVTDQLAMPELETAYLVRIIPQLHKK